VLHTALFAQTDTIASHKKKLSLLGGSSDPSYQPLQGGYHQREGYAVNRDYDESRNRMYMPNSRWTWAFSIIALVQACIVLAFESYVFATFQMDLQNGASGDVHSRTIPTFLTLYIFGFIYQLVLVWDALRLKNTIQVIGLVVYNIGLMIYGAVQMDQIKESVLALNANGQIDLQIWADTKPYLIAVPIVIAVGTVLLAICAWKLYDEFAWSSKVTPLFNPPQTNSFPSLQTHQRRPSNEATLPDLPSLYCPPQIRFLLLPRLHHPIRCHCHPTKTRIRSHNRRHSRHHHHPPRRSLVL
jgi:hypothetical protein